ncbi:hypothetical protein J4Q44_G00108920 [Coregonus suidteri]|uniref:Uncharacterized protein n=1 Tax=Coregonus suidteri TaxID=861788 RepID=A0AAN8MUF3_9TELE
MRLSCARLNGQAWLWPFMAGDSRTCGRTMRNHSILMPISGKTAAFMLPLLERLLYKPKEAKVTRVLVLLPGHPGACCGPPAGPVHQRYHLLGHGWSGPQIPGDGTADGT